MNRNIFLIIIITFLFNSCSAQELNERLYSFKKGNLYGFINNKGEIVVKPQYNTVGLFSEGLCAVVKRENNESKLGYINYTGELVIDLQFQQYLYEGSDFSEGLAVIRLNNKSGYINRKGEIVFEPTLYKGHPFKNGYAVIEKEYSERTIINKEGEILFDPVEQYKKQRQVKPTNKESLYLNDRVSDGVITFAITYYSTYPSTKKMGYFDMEGNMFFPFDYLVSNFNNELAKTYSNNRTKVGFIDKNGKIAIPLQFTTVSDFHNGKAIAQDSNTKKYGVIDAKGNYIIEPKYSYISKYFYKSDIVLVKDESRKTGYIDSRGNQITEFKYEFGLDFSEGLALVNSKENGYEFITKTGNFAFNLNFKPPLNYLGGGFKGDLAKVRIDKNDAYINKKGEVIFTF